MTYVASVVKARDMKLVKACTVIASLIIMTGALLLQYKVFTLLFNPLLTFCGARGATFVAPNL